MTRELTDDVGPRPTRVRPGEMTLMAAIGLLHEQGFETVRVLPYAAPSGMSFRFHIRALEDVRGDSPEAWDLSMFDAPDPVVRYSANGCDAFGARLFDELHCGTVTAEHLAWTLLGCLPAASRRPGADPAYVEWYRQVLELCEEMDDLPMAFADFDSGLDPAVTWQLAYQGTVTFPAPPPPPPSLIGVGGTAAVLASANQAGPRRDEHYVLDLCDELLGLGERQATFDWLRGDPSLGSGECRKLPVDGYWPEHGLVVEFQERQHTESVPFWDQKITATGMTRGEQRREYDRRKAELIPTKDLTLVVIDQKEFPMKRKKIARDRARDLEIVRHRLAEATAAVRSPRGTPGGRTSRP